MKATEQNKLFRRSVSEARDILSRDGNRLLLIFGLLAVLLSASPYLLLYQAESMIFSLFYLPVALSNLLFGILYGVTALVFSLFIFLPLWRGYVSLAHALARDEDGEITLLLSSFSSIGAYLCAVRNALALLLPTLPLSILTGVLCALLEYWIPDPFWSAPLTGTLVALSVPLCILVTLPRYGNTYFTLSAERMPWRRARKLAKKMNRAASAAPIRFALYCLPRLILGLLTIGVYLLADGIPMMLLVYCRELRAREAELLHDHTISEEIKDHE